MYNLPPNWSRFVISLELEPEFRAEPETVETKTRLQNTYIEQ